MPLSFPFEFECVLKRNFLALSDWTLNGIINFSQSILICIDFETSMRFLQINTWIAIFFRFFFFEGLCAIASASGICIWYKLSWSSNWNAQRNPKMLRKTFYAKRKWWISVNGANDLSQWNFDFGKIVTILCFHSIRSISIQFSILQWIFWSFESYLMCSQLSQLRQFPLR